MNSNTSSVSKNIFRNASFKKQSNSNLPDYWGLHSAAARSLQDHHDNYGVVSDIESPIKGVSVIQMINDDASFHHLMLVPRKLYKKLPDGNYTFSVYLKALTKGKKLVVTPGFNVGTPSVRFLSTNWKRYSVTYNLQGESLSILQPIIRFPEKGTYYVAAPQLEQGKVATVFRPSYEDSINRVNAPSLKHEIKHVINKLDAYFNNIINPLYSVSFEFDYYTNDPFARVYIKSTSNDVLSANLSCRDVGKNKKLDIIFSSNNLTVPSVINVPIQHLINATYHCTVDVFKNSIRIGQEFLKLNKLAVNDHEVRINNNKRYMTINNVPFYMIGISTDGGITLPDWYLKEVRQHGINTLFIKVEADKYGNYDIPTISKFLGKVDKNNLKVIIGWPLSGHKKENWKSVLTRFEKLVSSLKHETAIIGWYPIDEPSASSWSDDEVKTIYSRIKKIDPYKFVMVNWAYNGVPNVVGQQPRGTLAATDVYSIDYYPFQGLRHNIKGYAVTTQRMLQTSLLFNKVSHSWLQLYGYSDVWKEPSGDELNYMAYLNLIYGSMVSYWGPKSNSITTWQRVAVINNELNDITEFLHLSADAKQIGSVLTKGNFIYSLWIRNERIYLIVLHNGSSTENFEFNVTDYIPQKSIRKVNSFFDKSVLPLNNSNISTEFKPFESQVYEIETN